MHKLSQTSNSQTLPPIEIPASQLASETLNNLIESFILREGTDYGAQEVPLAKKLQEVLAQIAAKAVVIAFDPNTQSVTLMTSRDYQRMNTKTSMPTDEVSF